MSEIKLLCQEQDYNAETTAFLDQQWQKIRIYSEGYAVFMEQLEVYKNNISTFEHYPMLDKVHAVGEAVGIHPATMDAILLIFMLPILKEQYVEQNIPMKYYDRIVGSFRGHAEKTFETTGVATAGVAWWYMAYFKVKMFYIGRLIFKWRPFKETYTIGDTVIEEGTYHIDVHIPSGSPLTPELVHAAYDEAKEFFESHYNKKDLCFACSSWLLSPTLDEMLAPGSNILAFAHEYTIVREGLDPTGEKVGHFVFGSGVDMKNMDALPEKSSLHRAMKTRLKAGKGIGTGFGIILPKK